MTIEQPPSGLPLGPANSDPGVPPLADDHETMTHIVLEGFGQSDGGFVPFGPTVAESQQHHSVIRSLCGKAWIPARDPAQYPICPTCQEVAAEEGWRIPGATQTDG